LIYIFIVDAHWRKQNNATKPTASFLLPKASKRATQISGETDDDHDIGHRVHMYSLSRGFLVSFELQSLQCIAHH
jgi:hypothetical protein